MQRQKLLDFLLQNTVAMGKPWAVRRLLDWGADPNARDRTPWVVEMVDAYGETLSITPAHQYLPTVLMGAALAGRRDVIELLVAYGAEVDARNADGQTALMHAAIADQAEAARALLAAGADVNARDSEGKTAVGIAKELEKPGALSVLEAAGGEE